MEYLFTFVQVLFSAFHECLNIFLVWFCTPLVKINSKYFTFFVTTVNESFSTINNNNMKYNVIKIIIPRMVSDILVSKI